MKILFFILFSFSFLSAHALTVSGISSGAYMAQQFHTAFSSEVSGVGIVAGGPYFCAKGKIIDALNRCMKTHLGVPLASDSIKEAEELYKKNLIDDPSHLAHAQVYMISGTKDETVLQKVSDVLFETYKAWGVSSSSLHYDNNTAVGHAFPTLEFGNSCSTPSKSPYLSNCQKDVAGEILNHLLGKLRSPEPADLSRLYSFDQLNLVSGLEMDRLSMNKTGYAYIPNGCENRGSGCQVHVAFHGCKQTVEDIGGTFMKEAGYNRWAQSNKIIILYPQAVKNLLVNNPNGCWDWWGYSGSHFHTKEGAQMRVVSKMIEALQNGELQLHKSDL